MMMKKGSGGAFVFYSFPSRGLLMLMLLLRISPTQICCVVLRGLQMDLEICFSSATKTEVKTCQSQAWRKWKNRFNTIHTFGSFICCVRVGLDTYTFSFLHWWVQCPGWRQFWQKAEPPPPWLPPPPAPRCAFRKGDTIRKLHVCQKYFIMF